MNKLLSLLTLATLSAGPAYAQFYLVQTKIQSPQGWRLVGINNNATVFWIKPSSVRGDASDRSVLKISLNPDAKQTLKSWVHYNCGAAIQWQSTSRVKSRPLVIKKGSVWETIGKLICPPGTYGTAASVRPAAPLR